VLAESILVEGLNAREIDISYIDHSLTYQENKANLYNQFGIKFSQTNYSREYEKYSLMAASEVARIVEREEPNMTRVVKAPKPKAGKALPESFARCSRRLARMTA